MSFACTSDLKKIQEIQDFVDEEYPAETIIKSKLIYSDSAIVRVILEANHMDRYIGDEPHIKISNGFTVNFFNSIGQKESELTALYAEIHENSNLMEANEKVQVKSKSGNLLETENLIWDQQKEIIYTEDFVKITTDQELIYGKGFQSNQDFTKYQIKKVRGTIMIEEPNE